MAGLTKEQKAAKAAEDAAKAIEAGAVLLSGLDAEGFAALSDGERAAFLAQAQGAQKPASQAPKDKADDIHLVAMTKGGESLKVHPSCVADHGRLGWIEA